VAVRARAREPKAPPPVAQTATDVASEPKSSPSEVAVRARAREPKTSSAAETATDVALEPKSSPSEVPIRTRAREPKAPPPVAQTRGREPKKPEPELAALTFIAPEGFDVLFHTGDRDRIEKELRRLHTRGGS
jgi:hypothetical protein